MENFNATFQNDLETIDEEVRNIVEDLENPKKKKAK